MGLKGKGWASQDKRKERRTWGKNNNSLGKDWKRGDSNMMTRRENQKPQKVKKSKCKNHQKERGQRGSEKKGGKRLGERGKKTLFLEKKPEKIHGKLEKKDTFQTKRKAENGSRIRQGYRGGMGYSIGKKKRRDAKKHK